MPLFSLFSSGILGENGGGEGEEGEEGGGGEGGNDLGLKIGLCVIHWFPHFFYQLRSAIRTNEQTMDKWEE